MAKILFRALSYKREERESLKQKVEIHTCGIRALASIASGVLSLDL